MHVILWNLLFQVTKKLAGDVGDTASWMTNIANENGQVLNSVLTTGEGAALHPVCQGIVKRYTDAGEPPPEVIYVDRDCCTQSGMLLMQSIINSSFSFTHCMSDNNCLSLILKTELSKNNNVRSLCFEI